MAKSHRTNDRPLEPPEGFESVDDKRPPEPPEGFEDDGNGRPPEPPGGFRGGRRGGSGGRRRGDDPSDPSRYSGVVTVNGGTKSTLGNRYGQRAPKGC